MRATRIDRLFRRYRRRGDLKALGRVFDAVAPELYRIAVHVSGDLTEAEDLVQATFVAAIQGRERWDEERPVVPWLVGILMHRAQGEQRRRARDAAREAGPEELEPGTEARPDERARAAELEGRVARALGRVPPPYREVLALHLSEDQSAQEIARELGRAPGTVRVQLHRGLAILRKTLPATSIAVAGLAVPAGMDALRTSVLEVARHALPTTRTSLGAAAGTASGAGLVASLSINTKLAVLLAGSAALLGLTLLNVQAPSEEIPEVSMPAFGAPLQPGPKTPPPTVERTASRASPAEPAPAVASPPPEPAVAAESAVPSVASSAPLRGGPLVVDRVTKEPVPFYEARVHGLDGTLVTMTTDANGALPAPILHTSGADEERRLPILESVPTIDRELSRKRTFEPIDHPELAGRHAENHVRFDGAESGILGAEGRIYVLTGPTYSLQIVGGRSAPAQSFVAALPPWGLGHPVDRTAMDLAPVRSPDTLPDPWVRFAALRQQPQDALPPRELELISRDGLWRGTGTVTTLEGTQGAPVHVELEPAAAVRGRVRSDRGDSLAGLLLLLKRSSSTELWERRELRVRTEADGAFAFLGVRPGVYELNASSPSHESFEREIELHEGHLQTLDIVLHELSGSGSLAGSVTSRTGRFQADCSMRLVSKDGRHRVFGTKLEWRLGVAGWTADYRIDNLPAGEYTLGIRSNDAWFAFEPGTIDVVPPATDLDFVCQDNVATRRLAFHFFDETGQTIPEAQVTIRPRTGLGAGRTVGRGQESGAVAFQDIPVDMELDWWTQVDGYASVFGNEASFDKRSGDVESCAVHMRRGWGTRLLAVDLRGRPVTGLGILLDARPAGQTDANGALDLFAETRPGRIAGEGGAILIGTQIDHRTGEFSADSGRPIEVRVAQ